jgi:hypothetical protein
LDRLRLRVDRRDVRRIHAQMLASGGQRLLNRVALFRSLDLP